MRAVKLDDINELNLIMLELEAATYLQALLRYDKEEDICNGEYNYIQRFTEDYLLDMQEKIVSRLKALIEKETFFELYEKPTNQC